MKEKVEPRLARGLRDLLPAEAGARRHIIRVVTEVYERYGFVPLETPAIEYLEVLYGTGGEEAQRSIFEVLNPDNQEEQRLGLRYDLTVPLARVMAQYRELPRPFRRYQVAQVWRTDKPGPGRYRQFTQLDLDSVGTESPLADTEILTAMCDSLAALEVGPYRVRFSSRRVLNLLMPFAGVPAERAADVFRVLDKLDKLGPEKMRLELTTGYTDESGDPIPGLGLSADHVERIGRFLDIRADDRDELLAKLRTELSEIDGADEEIDVLASISHRLDRLGYGSDRVLIDLSIARGLAYYTGPVFEAVLLDAPQFGSVFGGGRYDDLVTRFLGERIPATGASIGVDRLLAALIELDRVPLRRSTAQVLVSTMDRALMDDYVDMAYELRRAGVPTEIYLGKEGRVGRQFKYADRCGLPVVVICGSDEKERGVVTLKNMAEGRTLTGSIAGREAWRQARPGQFEVPRADLVPAIQALLA